MPKTQTKNPPRSSSSSDGLTRFQALVLELVAPAFEAAPALMRQVGAQAETSHRPRATDMRAYLEAMGMAERGGSIGDIILQAPRRSPLEILEIAAGAKDLGAERLQVGDINIDFTMPRFPGGIVA